MKEGIEVINETTIRVGIYDGLDGGWQAKDITIKGLIDYFAIDARNMSSGLRSIGSIHGDWRCIDALAQDSLCAFKEINIDGLRSEAREHGLEPRF